MNAVRRFVARRRRNADPLGGLTPDMRDAMEAGAKSMLVFGEAGEVRAIVHFDRIVCQAVTMRVLLGLGLFEPMPEDATTLRLTRRGAQLARMSAARRASWASLRRREAANVIEGRAFVERMAQRRRETLQ